MELTSWRALTWTCGATTRTKPSAKVFTGNEPYPGTKGDPGFYCLEVWRSILLVPKAGQIHGLKYGEPFPGIKDGPGFVMFGGLENPFLVHFQPKLYQAVNLRF